MLMNRMTATMLATCAMAFSAASAEAQGTNSPFYSPPGARYYPAATRQAPVAVTPAASRAFCAPCNTGCVNGVCPMPGAVGGQSLGRVQYDAYGRRLQPVYYRVPSFQPTRSYPAPGYAVPANRYPVQYRNVYPTQVPNGYGRPVIINSPGPANGGNSRQAPLSAPRPQPGTGGTSSPFYP